MSRLTGASVTALVAVALLRLGLTDDHLIFVKASMGRWLTVSGVLIGGLAVAQFVLYQRDASSVDVEEDHGHAHAVPLTGILLVIPFLAIFVVPIGPLGAFAAGKQPARVATEQGRVDFPPLPPPVDGVTEVRITDFVDRARYDAAGSLGGRTVTLSGFVEEAGNDEFTLTRFVLGCCAADGRPVRVRVTGVATQLGIDDWVSVTGTLVPFSSEEPDPSITPVIQATSVSTIAEPSNPYE